jgi:2-oxoisovalerate ferredoxin oxidoreductase delta subunit
MSDGRRYGDGRGWGKGRGRGRGMGRGRGRVLGRGQCSAPLRDSMPFNQLHDVSSKILALKTHAWAIVNRLRGIDERVYRGEEAIPRRPTPVKEPLGQTSGVKRGPTTMIAVVDQDKCVRCGLCVDICPEHAVSMKDDDVKIDSDKCVACGVCVDECASEAISLSERTQHAVS